MSILRRPGKSMFRTVRFQAVWPCLAMLLAAHGTRAQKVTVEFDRTADFSRYKTFCHSRRRIEQQECRAQQRVGAQAD